MGNYFLQCRKKGTGGLNRNQVRIKQYHKKRKGYV